MLAAVVTASSAQTSAGVVLSNTAYASFTYKGANYKAVSNTVYGQVAAVESITLTNNATKLAAAGAGATFAHVLTNTGTVSAQVKLTYTDSNVSSSTHRGAQATGSFAPASVRYFVDGNGSGVYQQGDVEILAGQMITLSVGQSLSLLMVVTAPMTAQPGQIDVLQFQAASISGVAVATQSDTLKIAGSDVSLLKTASVSSAKGGDKIIYTLTARNAGATDANATAITIDGVAASYVVVRDPLPANTSFVAVTDNGGSRVLYHLASAGAVSEYVSAPPADLTTVDAIAFAAAAITPGASLQMSFQVRLHANAFGSIVNTAYVDYLDGSVMERMSNATTVTLPEFAPTLAYYDNAYAKNLYVTHAGSTLYVQGDASACNVNADALETVNIQIASTLTGDVENYTAKETGLNTGLFRVLTHVLTADISNTPAVSGDGVLTTEANDHLIATLSCSGKTASATMYVDPYGVVFDSKTNDVVPGAGVTLIDVTGQGNGGVAGGPALVYMADGVTKGKSSVTSDANGRFQFPVIAPSTYQLKVTPPTGFTAPSTVAASLLPSGRNIDANGSYLRSFTIGADGAGSVVFDVPLDETAVGGLFVEKTAGKNSAEVGDFVDYTVKISNQSGVLLHSVTLNDVLPKGFSYTKKTGRLNAKSSVEPTIKSQTMSFAIGNLAVGATSTLTYRVQVGPGSATGRNINRATATSSRTTSNTATAIVTVGGGVFTDEGYIIGRVSTKTPSGAQAGVPGVKVFLENGSYAITDSDGAYSIYGISPVTHVVKVDAYSLPRGAQLVSTGNRNSGDAASSFVDMKRGELRRIDFEVAYSERVARLIEAAAKRNNNDVEEVAQMAMRTLSSTTSTTSTTNNSQRVNERASGQLSGAAKSSDRNVAGDDAAVLYEGAKPQAGAQDVTETLEKRFAKVTSAKLGFLNLTEDQILANTMNDIWVISPIDREPELSVNYVVVPADRIGARMVLKDRGVQAVRFVAVDFTPGMNIIKAAYRDAMGNPRSAVVNVRVPAGAHMVRMSAPHVEPQADGFTLTPVHVELFDANGLPVLATQTITLESSAGKWMVKDLDEKTPGIQTTIEGGSATLMLQAPSEACEVKLRATMRGAKGEYSLRYVPEMRPMTAAGVVEYQLNFTSASKVQSIDGAEGFEDSLKLFSTGSGDVQAGGRSAVYLKGKILGSELLTLAYDSNKTSGTQLFRDIQPEQYYPVYGDSSAKGYDAQSVSRLYLRIDNGKNYLLYGDMRTSGEAQGVTNSTPRMLTGYDRSLNGAQQSWEGGRYKVKSFASYTSQQKVVEEFAANGTSGPYAFSHTNGVEGSETVELWTRDRNQLAVVLKKTPQTRFQDYEFEPFSGHLIFKSAIPTLDDDGDPIYIHVQYEVDNGGERAWVGGLEAQMKLTPGWTLGVNSALDSNPIEATQLYGMFTRIKLPGKAELGGEFADAHDQTIGAGLAYNLYYKVDGARLKVDTLMTRTDKDFSNLSSSYQKGVGEASGRVEYRFNSKTRLTAAFIRTEDQLNSVATVGGRMSLERLLGAYKVTLGFRHAQSGDSSSSGESSSSGGGMSSSASSVINTDQSSVSVRLSRAFTRLHNTAIGLSVEQDVADSDKHDVTADVATPIPHGKVYARHEFISSLGNEYTLNGSQSSYATKIGIESDAIKKLHLFSEYRDVDEMSSRNSEAAIGLRDTWKINKEWGVNASFEQVRVLGVLNHDGSTTTSSTGDNSLAITGGVECNVNGLRCGARIEYRTSSTSNSIMSSFSAGKKVSQRWTLLSRNVMLFQSSGSGGSQTRTSQVRFQTGAAYRGSTSSRWDGLALVEYRLQDGSSASTTNANMAIFSTHVNYQPKRGAMMNFQYATKWLVDKSNNLSTTSYNQLFSFHVTHDVTRRFDVGFVGRVLSNTSLSQRQNNFGAEVGFRVKQNLWLSTGYNFLGFYERYLPGGADARQGAYVRLRFKFDENILKAPGRTQLKNDSANLSK